MGNAFDEVRPSHGAIHGRIVEVVIVLVAATLVALALGYCTSLTTPRPT